MRFRDHVSVYIGQIDPDDPMVSRVFLWFPHRVFLSREDMEAGAMQPRRWRWMWWEYVFRRSCRYVDIFYDLYFLDDELEAKVQKILTKQAKLKERANVLG